MSAVSKVVVQVLLYGLLTKTNFLQKLSEKTEFVKDQSISLGDPILH